MFCGNQSGITLLTFKLITRFFGYEEQALPDIFCLFSLLIYMCQSYFSGLQDLQLRSSFSLRNLDLKVEKNVSLLVSSATFQLNDIVKL